MSTRTLLILVCLSWVRLGFGAGAFVEHRPSPERIEYFRDLLERAYTAPISDFFQLWYPEEAVPGMDEGYLHDCVDFVDLRMISYGDKLSPQCTPDVLYSWGPESKLNTIVEQLKTHRNWAGLRPNSRMIWATVSPVSTYSYGLISIRFKLKKGAVIRRGFGGESSVVEATGGLMDFLIKDAGSIESISYGTAEQYDEIVKDILRIESGKPVVTYSTGARGMKGIEAVYASGVPERGEQNERTLRRNLTELIKMILENKGEVIYAPGVRPNRAQHFATDHPTYFNEK